MQSETGALLHLIKVQEGEEVVEAIRAGVRELGISNGAVVSLIGAVGSAWISNMTRDDELANNPTRFEQPMELSGTGEITGGAVHLHVVLSTEDHRALAGHLLSAVVSRFFVRAYVMPLT